MVDFTLSPEIRDLRRRVAAFMDEHIYPNEERLLAEDDDAEALMREVQRRRPDRRERQGGEGVVAVGLGRPDIGVAERLELDDALALAPLPFGFDIGQAIRDLAPR